MNAVRKHRPARRRVRKPLLVAVVTVVATAGVAVTSSAEAAVPVEVQSLDGSGNNAANRVFNDVNQNVFSERQLTAWGWT